MTVHPSADQADIWASFKQEPAEAPQVINRGTIQEQCFKLIDDLDRICYHGCVLDNADIGAIQAKLQILRINLNVHWQADTQHKQAQPPQGAPDAAGPAPQEPAPVPAAILDQPLGHVWVERLEVVYFQD